MIRPALAAASLACAAAVCLAGPTIEAPPVPAVVPATEQEVQRMSQQRLAGAGLAREDVQAGFELELGAVQQQQVLDPELEEHAAGLPPGADGSTYQRPDARRPNFCRRRW